MLNSRQLTLLFLIILLSMGNVSAQKSKEVTINQLSFQTPMRSWADLGLLYSSQYHNSTQMYEEISMFQEKASGIFSYEEIGRTYWNKPIYAITITNQNAEYLKPKMLLVSGHHAREVITDEMSLRFILSLINEYGVDQEITNMINTMEIIIIPNLNADSKDYVIQNNDFWLRKNLVPFDNDGDGSIDEDGPDDVNGDGKVSCFDVFNVVGDTLEYVPSSFECTYFEGIDNDHDGLINEDHPGYTDLNRNYDAGWGIGSNTIDPQAQSYAGPSPFSENETRVLRNYLSGKKFSFAASIHSGTNFTFFPYYGVNYGNPSLHPYVLDDIHNLLPKSFSDSSNGRQVSVTAGLWRTWMDFALGTRVPFTFEVYTNSSVHNSDAYSVVVDNSTHYIEEWGGIFEYFNPNTEYIDDLYTDIDDVFMYMMKTTPHIQYDITGKISDNSLDLSIFMNNDSPRVSTDTITLNLERHNYTVSDILTANFNTTISINIPSPSESNSDAIIRIGNEYEGFELFKVQLSKSKLLFYPLSPLLLAIGTISIIQAGSKRRKH